MSSLALPSTALLPPLPIYRFRQDQFRRMMAEGILGPDEDVKWLDGLILLAGDPLLAPAIPVMVPNGDPDRGSWLPVRRFTLEEYHRMAHAGILGPDDHCELLEGWIVAKMTQHPPHLVVVGLVMEALLAKLPVGWYLNIQSPVATDVSEPEPDVAVIRGHRRDYLDRLPAPADMALAVEVADSSVRIDRAEKVPMYARNRLPVLWIVNIPGAQLEVYTEPTGPDPNPEYRQRQDYRAGENVPLVIDGRAVAHLSVADLLP